MKPFVGASPAWAIASALLMLGAGFFCAAAQALDPGNPRQDRDRIDKLEKRIAELERQVGDLKKLIEAIGEGLLLKEMAGAKSVDCANNLSQLWKMQNVYMCSPFGGRMRLMPEETGHAFWLALSKTQPPLIDDTMLDIFVCPLSAQKARAGFTTYRGPKEKVGTLRDADPVGCCEPGCHPDGTINVLLKSGDVKLVDPKDELYKRAMETTSGAHGAGDKEKKEMCGHLVDMLAMALKLYEFDHARYPASGNANMVKALQTKGPKKLEYFEFTKGMLNDKGEVVDPWGRPLIYYNNVDRSAPKEWKAHCTKGVDIYSLGPNGKDESGAGDDVNNWE